ncbi:hypothetical protein AVEN_88225-1 [Araneus ventricosus]|uniref:Uncharacterized protein n=1 Tax=Araneus ventricosus TaxID=182803 RepID=A0A4Y2VID1_ARAVE|nr:hypothetical protein AVEN_88225-1 [Araneus ventricosus]
MAMEHFVDRRSPFPSPRFCQYSKLQNMGKRESVPNATTQIVILVCSKFALQVCKLSENLSRQMCKCETSLQQLNASLEVTIGQTCSKFTAILHCKLIANYSKNRVRTQHGIELATSRFRSGDANH